MVLEKLLLNHKDQLEVLEELLLTIQVLVLVVLVLQIKDMLEQLVNKMQMEVIILYKMKLEVVEQVN